FPYTTLFRSDLIDTIKIQTVFSDWSNTRAGPVASLMRLLHRLHLPPEFRQNTRKCRKRPGSCPKVEGLFTTRIRRFQGRIYFLPTIRYLMCLVSHSCMETGLQP